MTAKSHADPHQKSGMTSAHVFIPVEVARVFRADFLDEEVCRRWILKTIHGDGEMMCPGCGAPLAGIALQRFWEGKRICCRTCGKFFTALTGTFLAGCHMTFREVILFAVFLHFRIPPREIARILRISVETVRLWEIKFKALEKMKARLLDMPAFDPVIGPDGGADESCPANEPEDRSDDPCPCGDPDCSRPFGHAEEGADA